MVEILTNPGLATVALEGAAYREPVVTDAKDGADGAGQARAAAEAFEGFFLAQVLQSIYAGIATDGPFGGGASEQVYRSMLNTQYANSLAGSGGVGIADAVYREILKLHEVTPS
jgi:Rod binding domain-containing protein